MHEPLLEFVQVLRKHDVGIGLAETYTAIEAVGEIGYADQADLKNALVSVFAGDEQERLVIQDCFDRFFVPATKTHSSEQQEAGDTDDDADDQQDTNDGVELTPQLEQLMSANNVQLQIAIDAAGQAVESNQIRYFTQQGQMMRRILDQLDWPVLQQALIQGTSMQSASMQSASGQGGQTGLSQLEKLANTLQEMAKEHVQRQYALNGQPQSSEMREQMLMTTPVRLLEVRQKKDLQILVNKIVKQLNRKFRRRPLEKNRGQLDVRKTLRSNMANGGMLFKPIWRQTHKDRPQVFVICDLSGSVASHAGLLLGIVSGLSEILPKTRCFAFSNKLGEVTDLFKQMPWEQAQEQAIKTWGWGSTDYGQALDDFWQQAGGSLKSDSVVIVLGDARNNNGASHVNVLERVAHNCKHVYWLNPEPRSSWNTGDSIVDTYKPHTSHMDTACTLTDLAEFCEYLLRNS